MYQNFCEKSLKKGSLKPKLEEMALLNLLMSLFRHLREKIEKFSPTIASSDHTVFELAKEQINHNVLQINHNVLEINHNVLQIKHNVLQINHNVLQITHLCTRSLSSLNYQHKRRHQDDSSEFIQSFFFHF